MTQSYQEVSKIIEEDLIGLYRLGIRDLNKIKLNEFEGGYQGFFEYRQNKNPKRYERLTFDKNGHYHFSKDLGEIFMDFLICGFLDFDQIISKRNFDNLVENFNPKYKSEKQ